MGQLSGTEAPPPLVLPHCRIQGRRRPVEEPAGGVGNGCAGSESGAIDPTRPRVVGIIDAELLLGWSRFQRTDPDDFVVKCAVGAPRSEFASDDDPIRKLGLHVGHERTLEGR